MNTIDLISRVNKKRESLNERHDDEVNDKIYTFDNRGFDEASAGETQDELQSLPSTSRPARSNRRPRMLEPIELPTESDEIFEAIGSESTTVGDSSNPTSRSSTAIVGGSRTGTPMLDMTISAAFRNKLRSRLKKTKAIVSQSSVSSDFQEEDTQIKSKVNERLNLKNKWRKHISEIADTDIAKTDPNLPTSQQAYDFFTKTFEKKDESPKILLQKEKSDEEEHEKVEEDTEDGDKKILLKDMFARETSLQLYERIDPIYIPRKQQIEDENKYLFYPSSEPLPNNLKYGRNSGQNPEDDGLYIGDLSSTHLNSRNSNKIQQRLYNEKGEGWLEYFRKFFSSSWSNASGSLESISVTSERRPLMRPLYEIQMPCSMSEVLAEKRETDTSQYELIVYISSLIFTSHKQFTDEHRYSRQLIDLVNKYNEIVNNKQIDALTQKISSLKKTITRFETKTKKGTKDEVTESESDEQRLLYYRELAYKTVEERRKKVLELRSILMSLLNVWEELRITRNKQGFCSTNVQLTFQEETALTDEIEAENELINELVNEAFEVEIKYKIESFESKMENYKKKLRTWKQWQRSQRRASKSDLNSPDNDATKVNDATDADKPEPPSETEVDKDAILRKCKDETYLFDGRSPGEPKFTDFAVNKSLLITASNQCPNSEKKRRKNIEDKKFSVEIFVDKISRIKSREFSMKNNFEVTFNETFEIRNSERPKELFVHILEKRSKHTIILSAVKLPIPNSSVTEPYLGDTHPFEFVEEDISPKNDSRSINTKGVINCFVYWSSKSCVLSSIDSDSQYSFYGMNIEQLSKWKEINLLTADPNDPDVIKLTEAFNRYESSLKVRSGSEVSTDDLMKEFAFGTKEDIEKSPRLRMLMLRAQGVPHLKGVQVPMYDREINMNLLEGSKAKSSSLLSSKGIDAKRDQGLKILSQLREQLIKQSQGTSGRRQTWEDMIVEEASSKLDFGINLFSPLENKRPLHPRRKERKKISGTVASNLDIKLIVTILYAINVPIRRDTTENASRRVSLTNELGDINYSTRVAPFVEVCFQRQTSRTNTADGPQPTWNETLSLKFRAPNDDISPSSLITMTDYVYLNLFDEVTIKEENGIKGERLERRWLGSLRIPISTLYLNSKVDGTFCLSTPPVLLGYEYDSKFWNLGSNNVNSANSSNTYLTMFLTIDPTLQLPEPLVLKCESNEEEDVLHQSQKWETEMSKNFSDRSFKALAIDLSGKFVVVSRYLRPIKPPEELIQNLSATEEVMQRLARFVSLIPFVSDNMALPGFGDVWCTSSEFLDMLIGDEEEHAILLCNFFLYLGKRAGIVLGKGIPEGMTSYVIVWEYTGQEPSVWNPSTGVKYSVRDVYLPLNNIGCIFTSENVYANIQDHTHPIDLNYDVTKSSFWCPLFTKKFPNPGLQSIQPEILNYSSIDQEYVQQLENKLERHLRDSLMRWRKKSRTFFNRKCIQQIKKILPRLEKKIGKLQQNDLIQDLEDILIVHQMTGFPLNMSFLDIESVTEAVYATGVHLVDDKKVDFALAVYIHPYPCNVLSVWVYIAALYKL